MSSTLKSIADAPKFQNFVTGVIVLAGVLVGIETYPNLVEQYNTILHLLDKVILGIFVIEAVIKIGAEGSKPWRYFYEPWNIFDFIIIAMAFMPFGSQYVTVLRLLRLLRVLRLFRFIPKLQILVGALLKSIPSMGYVGIFLFLLFYIYGVAGTFIFGQNDPIHFGNLQLSLLTLFQMVLLDNWGDLLATQMDGCNIVDYAKPDLCTSPNPQPILGPFYFVTFTLFGTMIILNLFIGVIMNSMAEAQSETESEEHKKRGEVEPTLSEELSALHSQLVDVQENLARLQVKFKK